VIARVADDMCCRSQDTVEDLPVVAAVLADPTRHDPSPRGIPDRDGTIIEDRLRDPPGSDSFRRRTGYRTTQTPGRSHFNQLASPAPFQKGLRGSRAIDALLGEQGATSTRLAGARTILSEGPCECRKPTKHYRGG
jgi:hypothetical protein